VPVEKKNIVLHSKKILNENMQRRQTESACDLGTVQAVFLEGSESSSSDISGQTVTLLIFELRNPEIRTRATNRYISAH